MHGWISRLATPGSGTALIAFSLGLVTLAAIVAARRRGLTGVVIATQAFAPLLNAGYRVIAFDGPGQGGARGVEFIAHAQDALRNRGVQFDLVGVAHRSASRTATACVVSAHPSPTP